MAQTLSLHFLLSSLHARKQANFQSNALPRKTQEAKSVSTDRKRIVYPTSNIPKFNSEVSSHRAVSAVRLMRIEMGGAYADLLNEKGKGSGENEMGYVERTLGFRTKDLDDRDLRLVTDIVGGTIRWRRYLDHLICSFCHDENVFRSMEPLLLQILRIGFYEILKLGMPAYAVVDENVTLAKVALRPGAGNLVNGILRKLVSAKESDELPLPKVEGNERAQARALATLYSHPVWMVRRWVKNFGQEKTIKLMNWNNSDPYFSIRANSAKGVSRMDLSNRLESLKVPHEISSHSKDFIRLKTGMQIIVLSGFLQDGICAVQDESAGLIVHVVNPQPGENIIDCCAAPGGKTLYMAAKLRGEGTVVAIDVNKGRLRILREAAKKHGVEDVVSTAPADIRSFVATHNKKYDKVLLDAPCSGLGVLSKRPDMRWNRRLEDMEELKNLQDELLDAASTMVKPGGILVYSTCSIDKEENEDRVDSFLDRHAAFSIESVDQFVPSDFVTERGFFFSDPVRHSLDGAFAARLRLRH